MPDTPSIFEEAFRQVLREGKYTSWAEHLTAEQLRTVLWAVGEFSIRARSEDAKTGLTIQWGDGLIGMWPINHARQRAALEILTKIRRHGGITFEDAMQMIRDAPKGHVAVSFEHKGFCASRSGQPCDCGAG